MSSPRATATRIPFTLPKGGSVLIFGDSWTQGLYANPLTKGYAYLTARALGLHGDVEGVGGTGYVNPGPAGQPHAGTYLQRLERLPASSPALVLIQGSYNDSHHPAAVILAAEEQTLTAFKTRFPRAEIVVVGTGSPDPTSDNRPAAKYAISLVDLDRVTRQAAAAASLNYVSPISERWFTAADARRVLTMDKPAPHPTNYGHALFARRLVADLRKLG